MHGSWTHTWFIYNLSRVISRLSTTFIPIIIIIYTLSRYHSNVQSFCYVHGTNTYVHGAIPLAFCSALLVPLCLPFVSLLTYLAPSCCDRNRPPRSQVACKLTPFAPPFTQPTPSLQIPRTPTAQRLTKTTSGIFRLLLSGTLMRIRILDICKF